MAISGQTRITAQDEVKYQDQKIFLGYSIVGIVLLIATYFGSMTCGTALGDFASMTVFP